MSAADSRGPDVRRIVVAGGSLAGWMAATALARVLHPGRFSITVTATDEGQEALAPLGAIDGTLPAAEPLNPALEIDEDRAVAATDGSFSLGIAVSGWNGAERTYFHPFSQVGGALGPVSFHHIALRLRRAGAPLRLANYSLAALAAQAGRFTRPSRDPASVISTLGYGLHLDTAKLANLYREEAERLGVAVRPGRLQRVEPGASGELSALVVADGERVEGDLVVDCTGVEARLHTALDDRDWQSWSAWLPCDRALTTVVDSDELPPPFSLSNAMQAGWLLSLPLRGRSAIVSLHASAGMDEEDALLQLRRLAGGRRLRDLHRHYVRFGRRGAPWRGNVVALGTAAALIDPVGVSNLQLLRAGLDYLLQLLPAGAEHAAEAAEFNRRYGLLLDHARDYAMAHYRLNGRVGEPFWDACRARELPPTLDYKIRLYESRGRVPMYDEEPLQEDLWTQLFDEHDLRPRAYNPIADGFRTADLQAHVQLVRTVMLDAVSKMPSHAEYLGNLSA